MPSLRDVQRSMHRALLDHTDTAAWPLVVDAGLSPGQRLAIYRNTMMGTLVNALRLCYPAVQRLVGADFFESAALIFVRDHPARCADLNAYGGEFADFLQGFEPAASLPYLPDVARLEWAVNRALHACHAPALDVKALGNIEPDRRDLVRFTAHPAISMLHSTYPVDAVWQCVLEQDDAAMAAIDLADGPVFLMVERQEEQVVVSRLGRAPWQFTTALFQGKPLAACLAAAPDVDGPALLAQHLVLGRCTGIFFDDFEEQR